MPRLAGGLAAGSSPEVSGTLTLSRAAPASNAAVRSTPARARSRYTMVLTHPEGLRGLALAAQRDHLRRRLEQGIPQPCVDLRVARLQIERARSAGEGLHHLLRAALRVVEPLQLPGDEPRPAVGEGDGDLFPLHFHPALTFVGDVKMTEPVFLKILEDQHDENGKNFMRTALRKLRGETADFGRSTWFLFRDDYEDPARAPDMPKWDGGGR